MATKHDRALASFLVGLDDVVEELSVVSDPQRSGELAEQLMAMGKQLKRVAPNAARGVPVAEAAKYLGVSEPTVRLWVRRGALAALPGSKPALIEHESLRRVGRAVREPFEDQSVPQLQTMAKIAASLSRGCERSDGYRSRSSSGLKGNSTSC
jgi:Helix-turn-helix domain